MKRPVDLRHAIVFVWLSVLTLIALYGYAKVLFMSRNGSW